MSFVPQVSEGVEESLQLLSLYQFVLSNLWPFNKRRPHSKYTLFFFFDMVMWLEVGVAETWTLLWDNVDLLSKSIQISLYTKIAVNYITARGMQIALSLISC